MFNRRSWFLALVAAFAVALAACGSGAVKESSQATPNGGAATIQAVTVHRGGTLAVALDVNPKTFDPMLASDVASAAVINNVFEGLYKYDENLKPVPWLAESVDQPNDTTYVFHLRHGVTFQDGTPMDAEAVKFSMDRIRENKKSPRYKDADQIVDTIVEDPSTFKVVLKEPFAPFPSRLTGGLGAVVSPTAVKELGDEKFGQNPVGTGPFSFVSWKSDDAIRVQKYAGYWRPGADGQPLPYLDGIEWRIIPDAATRLTALQTGDVDVVENGRIREQDLGLIEKDSNLVYKKQEGSSYLGLYLTINKAPFDNAALRQAVAYAIDRDDIVRAVYNDQREAAYGPIPPTLKWAVDPEFQPYRYDPAKAKAKLAEGGRPDGFDFEFWVAAGDAQAMQLGELMQAQLARVGIHMNIQQGDPNGVIVPKLQKGESNAYALGLTGGVDPDQWLSAAFGKGGGFNFFPYSNPKVDDLIAQGRRTTDLAQRAHIYQDAVRAIMDDSPYIFVLYTPDRYAGTKRVQGWYVGQKATAGYSEYWLKG